MGSMNMKLNCVIDLCIQFQIHDHGKFLIIRFLNFCARHQFT